MAGRHHVQRRAGASVFGRLRTRAALPTIAVGLAVITVVAIGFGGDRLMGLPRCGTRIHISVAAAPEIEPAVRAMTQQWDATNPRVAGGCVVADVTPAGPADVAAAIAERRGTTLNGMGRAAGDIRVPDVWIPDSTIWLQRLRAASPGSMPDDATSVARSPVVLAMPQPAATALGWPAKKLTWTDVLSKLTSDATMHAGIADPDRDAASTSGLLALAGAANATGTQQTMVAALRGLAAGRSALRADLLARFPTTAASTALPSGLTVAPLPEQAVISYNATQPAVPLAALTPDPAPVPLDYPYTVLPGATRTKAVAARAIMETLDGDAYRDRLAQQGLRAADGSAGRGFPATQGLPAQPSPPTPAPDAAAVNKLLSTWTAMIAPGRMLAVIDVSGSMATPVPTAGGATRDQVAVDAARQGLGLLDDTWAVGLWTFSTQMDAGNDWKQLVPLGPLSSQRQAIQAALPRVQPNPNGNTGLYNTVLAAYKNVQAGWDPGRVNSVLIMTDGKDEGAVGPTLDQLVAELKQARDPARPVEVIAVGIGDQVSQAELQTITSTTGGATFLAPDAAKIGEIFLQAIGLRANLNQ